MLPTTLGSSTNDLELRVNHDGGANVTLPIRTFDGNPVSVADLEPGSAFEVFRLNPSGGAAWVLIHAITPTVVAGEAIDVELSGAAYTVNVDIDGLTEIPNLRDADTLAIYDMTADTIRKVRADELESSIRIHKGTFDPSRSYSQGSVVETNANPTTLFWIASTNLVAGLPEPTLVDPHNWWLLATPNHFRGHLDHTITYNFLEGDWYRVDDRVFLTTATLTGVTGDDILGGHADIIELTGGGGGSSDTKVVTVLPDPADVADSDKGKVWIVQSAPGEGSEEVAHFTPIDEHQLTFTSERISFGTETLIGFDSTHGHALPDTTNIDTFGWHTGETDTQLHFTSARTPFDYHDWSQLAIYLRQVDDTGTWQRLWLEETTANSGVYKTQGAQPDRSVLTGRDYHLIIRHVSSQVLNSQVASVPSSNRLSMFPNGGRFRAFADLDALEHLSVVTEVNRVVDGEVSAVDLALVGSDLTITVERTIGADLTDTQALPAAGLPLTGGTLTGNLLINPGNVGGPVLTVTKGDLGGNPVVRMVHPDNTGNGQRPFNARRDGESDYFEVNGRLGGTSDNPGIGLGTGTGVRDVQLYRGGSNQLRTPDTFSAATLLLDNALALLEGGTGATTAAGRSHEPWTRYGCYCRYRDWKW